MKCQHCGKESNMEDMSWTHDRYGIPFKFVCYDCYEIVEKSASGYHYDYLDAGELLEGDRF